MCTISPRTAQGTFPLTPRTAINELCYSQSSPSQLLRLWPRIFFLLFWTSDGPVEVRAPCSSHHWTHKIAAFSLELSWRPVMLQDHIQRWLWGYMKTMQSVWFGCRHFRESSSYSRSQCLQHFRQKSSIQHSHYPLFPVWGSITAMILALKENGLGHRVHRSATPLLLAACGCSQHWLCISWLSSQRPRWPHRHFVTVTSTCVSWVWQLDIP